MRIYDLDKLPLAEIMDIVNKCNETTDAVLATGESWDDFMKRAAPLADVIIAVWRAPATYRGYEIGMLKGEGKMTLISQLPQSKGRKLSFLHIRLFNEKIAWATEALYGDGQAEAEDGGYKHLLGEAMFKGSSQEAERRRRQAKKAKKA